jgi:hypothetical protein
MRGISLLIVGATLAGCTAAAQQQPMRTAKAQKQFEQLIAGKEARPPVSCLPYYNSNDMVVIDDSTVAFKVANNRVYVNHMQGGCYNVGGPYALVTKGFGGTGLCRGDIAQVVDIANRMTVGSCVFGDFTPYVKPGIKG